MSTYISFITVNVDATERSKKKVKVEEKPDNKSRTKKDEKATDDYHYEKFKKQFRRY